VPDKLADPIITELDALDSTEIGTENIEGIPPGDIVRPPEMTNYNNANNTQNNTDETNEIIIEEKAPAFPGGTEAWLSFLRRFLQSPEELEPGQRVDVLIRFWVEADGSVSRPEILKSGGPAFDREVLRVLKKMPRWEPAVQNGRKIAVSYAQPISFVGVEE
jgi:protein TonB